MSERVVVAMSGGVDSSVAAALLVEQGYEVIGVTMSLVSGDSRCCSIDDADDARRVAELLGIRFYVANYKAAFQREVIEPFADAYLRGETPIPCVACNASFKFRHLVERAEALGASKLATGHYARIAPNRDTGGLDLLRGCYDEKDQSYFLFEMTQQQLARTIMPVGEMSKPEVRARAKALGLVTADKPESQEICFVPDDNYATVVEALRPEAAERAGEIVDSSGVVLGHHPGIHHFTIGQRKGLGLAGGERLYVTKIDAPTRRVFVGEAAELDVRVAFVGDVHWIAGTALQGPIRAKVKVRSRHEGAWAMLVPTDGTSLRIKFEEPVRAITPGQAAVFYGGDRVLGGGWLSGGPS